MVEPFDTSPREQEVQVQTGQVFLYGNLVVPKGARGLVLFAHGSGSGRHSPRNRYVAQVLQRAGLATLLLDLLTVREEEIDELTRQYRFDIPLLAERLSGATMWVKQQPTLKDLPLGYFGASTGAAAALIAAAEHPNEVKAVVSRGGRPDMADNALNRVQAPTLLLVGGQDYPVLALNEYALKRIPAHKQLIIVPGATHLFEEPGTLEAVAQHASEWFARHLAKAGTRAT